MVKECLRKLNILVQLFCCLLLVAGIVFYLNWDTDLSETANSDTSVTNVEKENLPSSEEVQLPKTASMLAASISFHSPAAYLGEDFSPAKQISDNISLWQDETDGRFYLFLPSHMGQEVCLTLSPSLKILLDNVPVSNQDTVFLTDGSHTLSLPDQTVSLSFEVLHSAGISTLYTRTQSGSLEYIQQSKEHLEPGAALLLDSQGQPLYQGAVTEFSGHGNSSWYATDKKSYQIKFPEQVNLFHMGAARDWILVSNAFDPSLLRNYITYHLADEMGLSYTPKATYIDWYEDGVYQGNYMLCEKIEIGKNRVNIADLEGDTRAVNGTDFLDTFPPISVGEENGRGSYKGFALQNPADITGGYLLSLELNNDVEPRYAAEASGFVTYRNQAVVLKRPVCASIEQVKYIRDLYQAAEDAIMDESGFNPETGFYYTHYIDVNSFARKYLLEEIVKNMDAQYSSQFFYKDADTVSTRLFAGPVWDYDRAWGTVGTRVGVDLMDPETFYVNQYTYEGTLWYGLYQQESFRNYAKRLFQKTALPSLENTLTDQIPALKEQLSASALMNDYRWHVSDDTDAAQKQLAYDEAVNAVQTFGTARMEFLKREWDAN